MNPVASLGRTIRTAARAQQIIAVAARFGFDDLVHDTGLDKWLDRGMRALHLRRPDAELQRLPQEVRVRKTLEELGPTFVKIGQVLSTRPDLIPPEWAREFETLQADVPPVSTEAIFEVLDAEFPQGRDAVFASIEEKPLAAGSMAQVHRATLIDGTEVVVKILRPGIRQQVETDMEVIGLLAQFVEKHFNNLGYSPKEVVAEFSRELQREVDLNREARSTDRLGRDFEDDEFVVFPRVYHGASTSAVLTLEEIHGLPLSKYTPGALSPEDLESVVKHGADAVFRQCLQTGFFHADPHPGNLFALEGGRIAFIDCGMTGHIEPGTQTALAELVHGVIRGDLDMVLSVVVKLSGTDPNIVNDRSIRADVWEFIARFENANLADINMGQLLQEFFDRLRAHQLRVPADLVFLIKALTTIQGVGEKLLPSFDFVSELQPYVVRLIRRRFGYRAVRRRLLMSAGDYVSLVEDLPTEVRSLLYDLRQKNLSLNLELHGLAKLISTADRGSSDISTALIMASLIMGASVTMLAGVLTEGRTTVIMLSLAAVGMVAAGALGAARIINALVRRR